MKRIFALLLVAVMMVSLCTLCGCSGKKSSQPENIYEDFEKFDSYVPAGSEIVGIWQMTAPETNIEWQFFGNTTLHKTKTVGEVSSTSVCTYNYDGEGNLKVYVFTEEAEEQYTVKFEDEKLIVADMDGKAMYFERIK
ncbi:MAG: hypothetical protein IJZ54_02875 [Clostridia bacterium]|nr:hypothetical protein [Clostridia bacterium]